jgi:hypothetical protein
MSRNRTLQFFGSAYGDGTEPVTLTVTVDGTQVFSGPVPTSNEPMPVDAHEKLTSVLFQIDNSTLFPTTFQGAYNHTVTVSGGYGIFLGVILCNWMDQKDINGNLIATGNATTFTSSYYSVPANSDNTPDSRSSVEIDGVPQPSLAEPAAGTLTRIVNSGSTLSCQLNISLGTSAIYA